MRLIDADAFKKILSEKEMQHDKRRSFDEYSYGAAGAYEYAGDLLDEQPTVEQPHGKWIYHAEWELDGECAYECSRCGMGVDVDYNFCPNCGSDNRKREGDQK